MGVKQILRISIDLDDTIWVINEVLVGIYNNTYDTNIEIKDMVKYDNRELFGGIDIYEKWMTHRFILNARWVENSVEVLNRLNEKYYIVFNTSGTPKTFEARHIKLKEKFEWYDERKLIRTINKGIYTPDEIMIDDCPHNFIGYTGLKNYTK